MQFSARVLRACVRHDIPCYLENPHNSRIWQAPPLRRLVNRCGCKVNIHDTCQYGARWLKPTPVALFNSMNDPAVQCTCHGRKGICSYTGLAHIPLTGWDKNSKQFWTQIAEPYPAALCQHYARLSRINIGCRYISSLNSLLS